MTIRAVLARDSKQSWQGCGDTGWEPLFPASAAPRENQSKSLCPPEPLNATPPHLLMIALPKNFPPQLQNFFLVFAPDKLAQCRIDQFLFRAKP